MSARGGTPEPVLKPVADPGAVVDAARGATACSSCAGAEATKTTTRSVGVSGELVRLRHALARLQAHTRALEIAFNEAETDRAPPGADAAQALMSTALEIATGLAKVDALIRAQSSEVE